MPTISDLIPKSVYGYNVRKPTAEEDTFFKSMPQVGGMAADDDQITLNPYSTLKNYEKGLVAQNEAMRIYMRQNDIDPQFTVTPQQAKFFEGSEYGKPGNEKYMRQTLMGRIYTGDPTAYATPEQTAIAKRIADGLRQRNNLSDLYE